jgi:hypothetical protein
MVERHRKTTQETWYSKDPYSYKRKEDSDFIRLKSLVILKCEHCPHETAYWCYSESGEDEDKRPVHIELAREELFTDKI